VGVVWEARERRDETQDYCKRKRRDDFKDALSFALLFKPFPHPRLPSLIKSFAITTTELSQERDAV
jgi:hypothetical protein